MKKVLIYGVGTFKNRGVEAIVKTSIDLLKDYEITIATFDIDNNKKYFTDRVQYINHRLSVEDLTPEEQEQYNRTCDPIEKERLLEKEVIQAIKDADICFSAGGDNYSYGDEYFLYTLDQEVKRQNKKLVLWGASLYEKIESELLVNDMNLFDALIIRESITYEALKKYVDNQKLFLIPDPAFTLKPQKTELDVFYKSKVVGINLSPVTIPNPVVGDDRFDSVITLIDYILKETKYNLSLISHVTTENFNDLDTLGAIYELYKENDRVRLEDSQYNCSELKYIISKCDMLIASRTHASIAAYSTNVPTLVVGYSVKSRGIAKDLFGTHDNYVIASGKLKGEKLKDNFIWLDKNKSKIKKELTKKSTQFIEKAKKMANNLDAFLEKEEKKVVCNSLRCTGCGLCSKLCPHGAITMEEDNEGFLVPRINHKRCIDCDLCRKKCPVLNNKEKNEYSLKSYALKNKNIDIQKKSTSGGIFSIFAKYILSKKGTVYGCEQNSSKTTHVRITKEKDLYRICGTKYTQSTILDIYEDIKKDLNNKKKVLFSGTACQVAAIKKYIGENPNLYTISVICHGVMSSKLLDKYINYLEKETNQKISNWKFRIKSENEWIESSISYDVGPVTKVCAFSEDKLMDLYIQNIILRESCYQCQFKGNFINSDLILGDAWGINKTHPFFYDKNGVSTIIINSKKGKELFEDAKTKKDAKMIEYNVEDIKYYNSCYYKCGERPIDRKKVFKEIDGSNIEKTFDAIDLVYFKTKSWRKETELKKSQEVVYELTQELDSIYNSRRWKWSSKLVEILKRKKQ